MDDLKDNTFALDIDNKFFDRMCKSPDLLGYVIARLFSDVTLEKVKLKHFNIVGTDKPVYHYDFEREN